MCNFCFQEADGCHLLSTTKNHVWLSKVEIKQTIKNWSEFPSFLFCFIYLRHGAAEANNQKKSKGINKRSLNKSLLSPAKRQESGSSDGAESQLDRRGKWIPEETNKLENEGENKVIGLRLKISWILSEGSEKMERTEIRIKTSWEDCWYCNQQLLLTFNTTGKHEIKENQSSPDFVTS